MVGLSQKGMRWSPKAGAMPESRQRSSTAVCCEALLGLGSVFARLQLGCTAASHSDGAEALLEVAHASVAGVSPIWSIRHSFNQELRFYVFVI